MTDNGAAMTYVILSLFWTVAGLVVGYWLGRAGRLEPHRESPTRQQPVPQRFLGIALVVLAFASVVGMAVFVAGQQQLVERQTAQFACQGEYNRAFSSALVERAEAASSERAGQRRLLDAAFARTPDPAAVDMAYRDYVALLAGAAAQRSANPLPERTC